MYQSTLCLKKTAPLRQVGINSPKLSSPIIIFDTRHYHSVADWLSSKILVRVEYQLQGFHGNQAMNNCMLFIKSTFGGNVALIIAYKWRHHNKTHSFYSELNSLQNVYFRFFCIWKITEFIPTCLRGAVVFETQCTCRSDVLLSASLCYVVVSCSWSRESRTVWNCLVIWNQP